LRRASDSAHFASMRSGIFPHMPIGSGTFTSPVCLSVYPRVYCAYDSQRATAQSGSLKSCRSTATFAAAGFSLPSQTSRHSPSSPHQ
jgi:hypothetical protein